MDGFDEKSRNANRGVFFSRIYYFRFLLSFRHIESFSLYLHHRRENGKKESDKNRASNWITMPTVHVRTYHNYSSSSKASISFFAKITLIF